MPETQVDDRPVSATVVVAHQVLPGQEQAYLHWQAEVNDRCRSFPGCQAVDVVPPVGGIQPDYVVVYRFDTVPHLNAWLDSPVRRDLLARGAPLFSEAARQEVVAGSATGVGMVVSTRVKPGQEEAYLDWQRSIDAASARFPGYIGHEILPPVPGVQDAFVVVVRFDTAEHLQDWLDSDVRKRLVDEAAPLWEEARVESFAGGFPGWFSPSSAGPSGPILPPNWKQAMAVLLVLFPMVRLIQIHLEPHMMFMPFSLMIFVEDALGVILLTWLLMPLVNRALASWLHLPSPRDWRREAPWIGVVIAVYALTLWIFLTFT